MLINENKYRGARAAVSSKPSARPAGKKNVQLHLPSHEVHNDTDICQKARYAPGETGSRDGVSNRHQSRRRCFNARVILRQAA